MKEVEKALDAAMEPARRAAEVVEKLRQLGVIYYCPDRLYTPDAANWLGFVSSAPKYGRADKYGWQRVFVPVVRIVHQDGVEVVCWHPDVKEPVKLLQKLVEKYHQRSAAVADMRTL